METIAQIIVKCKTCATEVDIPDCVSCKKLAKRVERAWNLMSKLDDFVKLYMDSTVEVFGDANSHSKKEW